MRHGFGLMNAKTLAVFALSVAICLSVPARQKLQAASHGEVPELRVGLLSDTHVTPDPASCDRVRKAFKIFRRESVDAVAHLGDLADLHWPEAYRNYRAAIDAVWPEGAAKPRFLYAWGNHDSIDCERRNQKDRQMDRAVAFATMKRALGIGHDLAWQETVKGYTFLCVPEIPQDVWDSKTCRDRIEAACAATPDRPVFFLHHPPARDTVDFTAGESLRFKKQLSNHPNVVALNGHRHTSVMNERSIWQGGYTAVETGCLCQWCGFDSNVTARAYQAYGVMVMDVFGDRIDIRRFDVRDGREFKPSARWSFPLPFDPGAAPYAASRRAANERPASFPGGAKVRLRCEESGKARRPVLSIPSTTDPTAVAHYAIEIERREGDGWVPYSAATVKADFDDPPSLRKGFVEAFVQAKVFADPGEFRFTVRPVGFFGAMGETLVCAGTFRK